MPALRYFYVGSQIHGIIYPTLSSKLLPPEPSNLFNIISLHPETIQLNTIKYRNGYLHTIPRKKSKSDSLEVLIARGILNYDRLRFGKPEYRPNMKLFNTDPRLEEYKKENKHYMALRSEAFKTFNGMWKRVVNEAADKEALIIARRFPVDVRFLIYEKCCESKKFAQLTQTFPLLAIVSSFGAGQICNEVYEMIEAGVKLKEVAKHAMVPYFLRNVKPQNTIVFDSRLLTFLSENKERCAEIFNAFMPYKTMEQYRWLILMKRYACSNEPIQWERWLAQNINTKLKIVDAINIISDLNDWADSVNYNINCSWDTALERSQRWHKQLQEQWRIEAEIRAQLSKQKQLEEEKLLDVQLAKPWIEAYKENDFEIVPLDTAAKLIDESKEMHHCVKQYREKIQKETCCMYSVRKGEERFATVEIIKVYNTYMNKIYERYEINQMKAKWNYAPGEEIRELVFKWLSKENKKLKALTAKKVELVYGDKRISVISRY